jgi:hypothetical protein
VMEGRITIAKISRMLAPMRRNTRVAGLIIVCL